MPVVKGNTVKEDQSGLSLGSFSPNLSQRIPPEDTLARIDQKTIEELQAFVAEWPDLQRQIKDGNEIMRAEQEIQLQMRSWIGKNEGGMKVIDLFRAFPQLIENFPPFRTFGKDMEWDSTVRMASATELEFLKQGRKIFPGWYTEVGQICAFDQSGKAFSVHVVGHPYGIGKEIVGERIEPLKGRTNLVGVWLFHSHFDDLDLIRLPLDADQNFDINGLLRIGGISGKDVKFADSVWREYVKRSCPVRISAFSEKGVTYTYQAGNSIELTTD